MPANHSQSTAWLTGTTEKIILVALWLLLAVGFHHWVTQGLLLLAGLLLMPRLMVNRGNRWKLLLVGASFMLVGTIGLIFETGARAPQAVWQFQLMGLWWSITPQSLLKAAVTALKALNGLMAIQLAMATLSFAEGITLARRIRLPEVFVELMVLAYRYLFGVKKCANAVMMAQRQRLGYAGFRTSLNSLAGMLSAVFVKSLRLSFQNYQAMQVRAYHGRTYCPQQWEKSSNVRILLIATVALCFGATALIPL